MRFRVQRMYERGRRLPDREISNRPKVEGEMRCVGGYDNVKKRLVQRATLHHDNGVGGIKGALVPDLLDIMVSGMVNACFGLTGFEEIDGVEYRQTWIIWQVK